MKRTLWMFPRNKRKSSPTEVGLMIRALSNALATSDSSSIADQEAQNALVETMNALELKSGGDLQHANSGGARTYLAYFKQLGLIFERENPSGAKSTYLTLAGAQIADLLDPASVIRRQVLRMQFPSPYSLGTQVDIAPEVEVRPAIFVTEMANSGRLNGVISDEDVAVAVIYGRNHGCLTKVIEKCLTAREYVGKCPGVVSKQTRKDALASIIDNPLADLFTTKTVHQYDPSDPATFISKRLDDVLDIANTLTNRMVSAGVLIKSFELGTGSYGTTQFYVNRRLLREIDHIKSETISKSSTYASEEAWQRRLGRGFMSKDTRSNIKCTKYRVSAPEERLKQDTLKHYQDYGTLFDIDVFSFEYSRKMGKSAEDIKKIVFSVLPNSLDDVERQLIASATDPKKHHAFEVNVKNFFAANFLDCEVKHLGQVSRKDKSQTTHDFCDVLVHFPDHSIVQIDTKSTSKDKGYEFSASEQTKSEAYVRFADELYLHSEDRQTSFLLIAPGFTEGAVKRAELSTNRTGIPFVLLKIRDLVTMVTATQGRPHAFLESLNSYSTIGRASTAR